MKKLLPLLFLCGMVASVHAQGVSGGIKAGINYSNMAFTAGSVSLNTTSIIGFQGGFYLTSMLSEKIGIQPEAYYSMQGSELEVSPGLKGTFKLSYLNIPVLFRFNPNSAINFHAGPQFGFKLSAKGESGGTTTDIDDLKAIDIGGVIGLGFDLPMGLNGGVRYVIGFTDINDDGTSTGTIKNQNVQVYLGFKLFGD